MHIPDGILNPALMIGCNLVAVGVTGYALRHIERQPDPRAAIPKTALLTAAFFISSSLRLPIPPVSVHLLLCGLMGVLLGWYAIPSLLIGLVLQAIVFGHGGITTLGANLLVMGLPALLMGWLFSRNVRANTSLKTLTIWGFIVGTLGVVLAVTLFFGMMLTSLGDLDRAKEIQSMLALCLAHLPLALLEGVFTAFLVSYLYRVQPDLIRLSFAKAS